MAEFNFKVGKPSELLIFDTSYYHFTDRVVEQAACLGDKVRQVCIA